MAASESLPLLAALPEPPLCELRVLEEMSPEEPGFLRLVRRRIQVALTEEEAPGALAAPLGPFVYDEVDRRALDAVVVVAHFPAPEGAPVAPGIRMVVLRSAHRPPVVLRTADRSPLGEPEPARRGLWEIPAGLVEPDEASPSGLARAAARELWEETGFRVEPSVLAPLGPSSFPCPGVIGERHFYFHGEVDVSSRGEPALDGSPLEAVGRLVAVPLSVALTAARQGLLADAKTELAVRRLAEVLA